MRLSLREVITYVIVVMNVNVLQASQAHKAGHLVKYIGRSELTIEGTWISTNTDEKVRILILQSISVLNIKSCKLSRRYVKGATE